MGRESPIVPRCPKRRTQVDCLFVLIALLSPPLAVALMCSPVEAHSAGVPAARGYQPRRRSRPRGGRSTVCCTGRRSPSDLHVHAGFDDEWQVNVASGQDARRLELSVLRACEHVLDQRSEFLVRQGRQLQQPACNRPSSRSDIESTAGGPTAPARLRGADQHRAAPGLA
jgi:hypothetical protein